MLGNSVNVIPILKARYIGRPLLQSLTKNSFIGSVVGIYQDFCNILGNDGRMITLAISPIGKSPFSVLIEWQDSFTSILAKMNVRADQFGIKVGDAIFISLDSANTWEPKMHQFPPTFRLKASSAELLINYTQWPRKLFKNSSNNYARDKLICGARNLQHALVNGYSIKKAVKSLAGLGPGLTPAGDDYLLGIMASLWLTKNTNFLEEIGWISSQKTTSLSAAYLMAGAKGEFAEYWHHLAKAILCQDPKILRKNISNFIQIGASSGRDALAGFSAHILKSKFSLNTVQN
ncbi:MAG TPA: DUF2877 domain-containing protein [Gammaproteobacteria bacterium]|nr:DUF2877 domain-containing protein [Gammaproteobacteria bacterium]